MIEILWKSAARTACRQARQTAGFSLVEMAVVTLLIGIFLTMGLAAFRASQNSQALSTTLAKQNAIKEALIGYLRRTGHLPCADVNFSAPKGVEYRSTFGVPTTPCATTPTNARFGLVPYATLGLARDAAVDGWGNFFGYQVSNGYYQEPFSPGYNITPLGYYNTPIWAPYRDWTLNDSGSPHLRSGSTGEITVYDRTASGSVITVATSVVAVIVSYGPNGYGAHTISGTANSPPPGADELQNTDGDTTYFRRAATTDDAATGGAFDDRVMFLTADDLFGPLFKDGSVKSPNAVLADTFQKIRTAVSRYALAHQTGYGGSGCTNYGASTQCRYLPYADWYNGDGNQNSGVYDGGVPWSDIGMAAFDTWDPWGRPVRYAPNNAISIYSTGSGNGISGSNPAGATTAYTLTSFGPDRTPQTPDDVTITITVGDLRTDLSGALP